ncbi:DUF1508 domain-containing protein [Flavobacterium agrisoli]|uniref:DUF1508 domain-containing protein n=1 Tax=Flavobacterium agrisoli TaxID=2793066 RepID=A0A934PN89_9FLAO|nr:DUF1508 domain-containing protein [Flavobacterium agrisoli]MBK0370315.1 DUF1508 domain-containing protein [Flavobacterium agrisoli]
MGAFVVSKRFNGEYKFVFTSRKGKVVFTSLSYELKFECEEAVERFKSKIDSADFKKFKSSGGKYFFKLVFEGKHFATSRKYSTSLMLQKGIAEIVKYGGQSELLDFTDNPFFDEEEIEMEEEL